MTDALGVVAIGTGAALGLLTYFVLWKRVPAIVGVSAAVAAGATTGAGALLVQDAATAADWIFTLGVLGALTPVHAKLLFGAPGKAT